MLDVRSKVDWWLFVPAFLISLAGLITMNSFSGAQHFFVRQIVWILVAVAVFFAAHFVDWRFLRQTRVLVPLFIGTIIVLLMLFVLGHVSNGAKSWFSIGGFALEPSDPAIIVLILMLAKYFSRRHIEIANVRHVIVSGVYAFLIFILIFLEPDVGAAAIVLAVWLGMVLVSGISKKHLFIVMAIVVVAVGGLWIGVFKQYQKDRILTFLHPLSDIHGAGYNAYQSTIAVGSGQILGKGIGEGSQSKLLFLPEYQTDFIFAAFAEEWGFIGTLLLLILAFALVYRIVENAERASTNFESLFGMGLAILFTIHILIHAGMDMGVLPITGIVFPFMSYGGSHLLTEWLSLGILSSMKGQGLSIRTSQT